MRHLFAIFAACIIAATACTAPAEESNIDSAVGGRLIVDIVASDSRIALSERENDRYPLHWSEGDRISINGILSDEAQIDADNPRSASFTTTSTLSYPYSILYPASTEGIVEFPATQHYAAATVDSKAMVMYGYATQGTHLTMRHLCSVLRFSVTGTATLSSMEIAAERGSLAGRYTIDCTTGALSTPNHCSSNVTYSFDEGLCLTDTPQHFFVTLPAGDHGKCSATLRDADGNTMRLNFDTTANDALCAGVVREFQVIEFKPKSEVMLEAMTSSDDELLIFGEATGRVRYTDGTPAVGVAVSDGYKVVLTDENGEYYFTPSKDTWHIFISLPADCRISTNREGLPNFYHLYEPNVIRRYDFTLERLERGVEKEFILYVLGDPQVASSTALTRFRNESLPALRSHTQGQTLPCYGIVLGDITSSGTNTDNSSYMPILRSDLNTIGIPIFPVMGNHDHRGEQTLNTNSRNSTLRLAAQRTYEDYFGPANYSFNRGNVHFVVMMDIYYTDTATDKHFDYSSYRVDYSNEQVEWLRQDLAVVPKDKMVVLSQHAQLYGSAVTRTNIKRALDMLDEFADARLLAGHSHDVRNHQVSGHRSIEHVAGAICGAWWNSVLARDGSPNGFATFHIDGSTIRNHIYHGINEGHNAPDNQIRLYRGSMLSGGSYEYFASPYDASTLIANVWNGGYGWTVEAYVGNQRIGEMKHMELYEGDPWMYDSSGKKLSTEEYNALQPTIKAQTSPENPTRLKNNSTIDWWIEGYLIGVRGWAKRSQALSAASNMYHIKSSLLEDDEAWKKIRVVAKDPYGNTYSASEVIQGQVDIDFDYTSAVAPKW